jgi:hypothetical protein
MSTNRRPFSPTEVTDALSSMPSGGRFYIFSFILFLSCCSDDGGDSLTRPTSLFYFLAERIWNVKQKEKPGHYFPVGFLSCCQERLIMGSSDALAKHIFRMHDTEVSREECERVVREYRAWTGLPSNRRRG